MLELICLWLKNYTEAIINRQEKVGFKQLSLIAAKRVGQASFQRGQATNRTSDTEKQSRDMWNNKGHEYKNP